MTDKLRNKSKTLFGLDKFNKSKSIWIKKVVLLSK